MKKQVFNILYQVLIGAFIVLFVWSAVVLYSGHQARQARFSVDALEEYLQAYRLVEKKSIERLSELPDFHLAAPAANLSLKSQDLKQGIKGGYFYDLQYLGNDQFVISASPAGIFALYEFGITDKGVLRMNNQNVDIAADGYAEVEQWPVVTRDERVRTKDLPSYLK